MYDKALIDNLLVKIVDEAKLHMEIGNTKDFIKGDISKKHLKKEEIRSFSFVGKAITVTPGDYFYKNTNFDGGLVPVAYLQKCIDSHSKDNEFRVYERIMRIDSPFR